MIFNTYKIEDFFNHLAVSRDFVLTSVSASASADICHIGIGIGRTDVFPHRSHTTNWFFGLLLHHCIYASHVPFSFTTGMIIVYLDHITFFGSQILFSFLTSAR